VGDRRDEDTIALGAQAARMFNEIVIRQDKNLRGRSEDEIIELITRGIKQVDPNKKVTSFKKERDAIDFAIKNARRGTFLTICSDVVPDALDQIMKLKEQEDLGEIELGLDE
jgi:cyanophycin synthetase